MPKISASTVFVYSETIYEWVINKLRNITPKFKNRDEDTKLTKSAILLKRLKEENIELLFIDELSVSERFYKPYGWRLKNKDFWCFIWGSFSISMIFGISNEK